MLESPVHDDESDPRKHEIWSEHNILYYKLVTP